MFLENTCYLLKWYKVLRKYYEPDKEYRAEEKYLYLLLVAPGYTNRLDEPIRGNAWLHKIMHVLSQGHEELNYDFDAHEFGTFSPDLQTIQIQNTTSDMIRQENKNAPLCLTDKGLKTARKLWREISDSERKIISETKHFFNDMSLMELIAFSYAIFPETTTSEIIPKFHHTRLKSAISLFKRQKISLRKASSIAGITEDEFIQELKKRKIPAYSVSRSYFETSLKHVENIT